MFRPSLDGGLVLGMSDTIILNRARWGRPHKITRARSPEGFREEWTYVSRADGSTRVLQFLNGRLAGMDLAARPAIAATPEAAPVAVQPPPVPVAIAPDPSARMRVAAVWSEDDETAAERAQQAAKVLERAGLVPSRRIEQSAAGPLPGVDAAAKANTARIPSASVTAAAGSDTVALDRNEASTGATSSHDAIVMVQTPPPETQPQ